jgi:hypothetical protein
MPLHPTHRFIAEYNGHLAGVIIMSMGKLLSVKSKDSAASGIRYDCSWSIAVPTVSVRPSRMRR